MNILLATPSPAVVGPRANPSLEEVARYNDGAQDWWVYLCTADLTDQYPGSKLIGVWDSDGTVANQDGGDPYPIDPDYRTYIRPFGNAKIQVLDDDGNVIGEEDGVATDSLNFPHWAGNKQRWLQATPATDTAPEYPEDEQPIVLTMERFWYDVAPWEGWAWRATIEFSDPSRPPNARAIGIYDDQWGYQYTTGAFVWTDTGEVNENNEPIFKWQTETPAGRATPNKEPIYYALLLGSVQEGRIVLPAESDRRQDYFWEDNQSGAPPPGGSEWVDTGQTVTGNFGTITGVSGDKTEFALGEQVRIEGIEGTVESYWAGGDGIEILPNNQYTIGASIEAWRSPIAFVTDLGAVVTDNNEAVEYG